MDRVFVEEEVNGTYRVAVIDKHRIFQSKNPGELGTVFECSLENPTTEDDAQIFYAMAPSIGGIDIFTDLKEPHRSCKLNTWTVGVKDAEIDNIFNALQPLTKEEKVKLYTVKHGISPTETVTSTSNSVFSFVAFAQKRQWKTGILQRCVDSLVLPQYRHNPYVYTSIDENYRRVMRFKFETEYVGIPDIPDGFIVEVVRIVLSQLGLRNSRDTKVFTTIPDTVKCFTRVFPKLCSGLPLLGLLSNALSMWCGSTIVECETGYRLELDPSVTQALSYTQRLLTRPKMLAILETPM